MPVIGYLSLLVIGTVAAVALVIASFLLTNPLGIGPLGVTMWFVVVYFAISGCLALALFAVKTFLKIHATRAGRLRYSWRQGMLIGGWVTGLLALSSLNQLGLRDAILLALLLVIVEVYVRLRWP